jgi:flagellar biosynthesis/type III secretory pathway M-ring protein FliF/YscJ
MRLRTAPFTASFLILLGAAAFIHSQESGYLSQKLLLENTIQQRITNAVAKILDESQFVVDVKIELAFTPSRQVETVYRTPDGRLVEPGVSRPGDAGARDILEDEERSSQAVTNPFPIPGFPDVETEVLEPTRPLDEDDFPVTGDEAAFGDDFAEAGESIETTSEFTGGLPNIRSMGISIILEDGVSPQIIENVRQVALIASRFDRDRGDILSITTASFKDRRPTPGMAGTDMPITEIQIEQTNELQAKLQEAQARNDELMKELRDREMEYLQRSEEERKQALSDLAQVQNERAKDLIFLQTQREEQNARLQEALLTQIDEMRKDITGGELTDEEQDIVSFQAASLEDSLNAMRLAFAAEKERLQEQIEAALGREPPPPQGLGGMMDSGLVILIGVVLLAAIVIVAIVLATSRSRAQVAPAAMVYPGQMAPPYPRRRRPGPPRNAPPSKAKKKKVKPKEAEEEEPTPAAKPVVAEEAAPVESKPDVPDEEPAEEAEAAVKAAEPVPSHVEEDPEVLRSELKSIRQSVVSMSVGRPESATRILSDWLQQEGPPEEKAAPEEAGEVPPEIDEAIGEEES